MSIQRLKNLVIAALLLINLFFLTDILLDRVSDATERSHTIESLRDVMATSGIAFTDNAVSDVTVLDAFVTSQDAFAEAVIARAILGDCEPVQTDSGQMYAGARGTASFNSRGVFVIDLTERFEPSGVTIERAVKKLLKSMSIDTSEPAVTVFGDTTTVIAQCTWRDSPIFNSTVTFTFSGNELVNVEGLRPSGVSDAPGGSHISFSTAMLSFLRHERAQETASTVIVSIDPGYRLNVGTFGDGSLTPGWLIVTDTGPYFVDASTGEIMRNDV